MDKRKEAKKIANKRYYEQTKAKLRELSEIKNNTEETETKEQDNFFFRQNQNQKKEPPLPEVKPQPQQIIVQAPPVKVNLKTRILETTILSMIPILPLIIKQFLNILQTRQHKPQQEQEQQPNMQYQRVNLYDF